MNIYHRRPCTQKIYIARPHFIAKGCRTSIDSDIPANLLEINWISYPAGGTPMCRPKLSRSDRRPIAVDNQIVVPFALPTRAHTTKMYTKFKPNACWRSRYCTHSTWMRQHEPGKAVMQHEHTNPSGVIVHGRLELHQTPQHCSFLFSRWRSTLSFRQSGRQCECDNINTRMASMVKLLSSIYKLTKPAEYAKFRYRCMEW